MRTKIVTLALVGLLAVSAFAAEKKEDITTSYPAPAGKVVLIDAGALDLFVRVAEISEIRVRVELVAAAFSETQAKAWIEAHRPQTTDSEEELRITAPSPSGLSLFKGVFVSRARIEIVLPSKVRPDLSTTSGNLRADGEFIAAMPLRLRTAAGDIEFSGWAPEMEARSTSGSIQLRASKSINKLMARSSSGAVLLTGGAKSVRCDTSTGDVRLEGLVGPVGVATTSGVVVASFDSLGATDEVRISTSTGKVRVVLPPNTLPGGELISTKAEIRSAHPGESDPKGGRLRLTGNGPKVFIGTTSGRIDLM